MVYKRWLQKNSIELRRLISSQFLFLFVDMVELMVYNTNIDRR